MVAFDASVLCNAILNEQSLDFELLVAAASAVPFTGFTTDLAGMEFVRNASEGFRTAEGVRAFSRNQIDEQTIGLGHAACHLGEELGPGHPDGDGQPDPLADITA